MTTPFHTTRRVEFCETDMAGIVHFANFYRYMEMAEHEFIRSRGLEMMLRTEEGAILGWPRVSASCSFESPAYYDDILDVKVGILRQGVKSLTLRFEFRRGSTRIAHGQIKTVCCIFRPGETMRSIEIPDHYRKVLTETEGWDS